MRGSPGNRIGLLERGPDSKDLNVGDAAAKSHGHNLDESALDHLDAEFNVS